MITTGLGTRVHRRTGIVTYAAFSRDFPIAQAEHCYETIQINLRRTALSIISTIITVTLMRTHCGPRRSYKYHHRVPRTPRKEKGGTQVPTDLYCATLQLSYLIDNS